MNNDAFYETLPVSVLEEFAENTFGNPPSDLEMMLPFIKSPVLEVGAGTGRIGAELVSQGYDYTGIDKQSGYLQVFRERMPDARLLNIPFEELSGNYETILFPWTVIGDFSKEDQNS